MRCPKCQGNVLAIEIQFQGFLTVSFDDANQLRLMEPISLDSRWESESPCICKECSWQGTVAEAQFRYPSDIDDES